MDGRKTFVSLLCAICMVQPCLSQLNYDHRCDEDPDTPGNIRFTLRVTPNGDDFHSVYAFQTSTTNFGLADNRVGECNATVTDPSVDTATIAVIIDPTASGPFACGASVTSAIVDGNRVYYADFLFYIYSQSDTMAVNGDTIISMTCSSNDLNPDYISSGIVEQQDERTPVERQQFLVGAYLVARDEGSFPVRNVDIGGTICLSVEYQPFLDEGEDNCGTLFHIGFPANDNLTSSSAAALRIIVSPKYRTPTYVLVTAGNFTENQTSEAGESLTFDFDVGLMGCSDDDEIEKALNGIVVDSYPYEVCLLVISEESGSEEHYTPFSDDVLGMSYSAVSSGLGDSSVLMVIGTKDSTNVNITFPVGVPSVMYNGNPISPGTFTETLDELESLHLSLSESVTGFSIESDEKVAVIIAEQNVGGSYLIEPLLPDDRLGNNYVFFAMTVPIVMGGTQETHYMVQSTVPGVTILKRYTSTNSYDTFALDDSSPTQTFVLNQGDTPYEIEADNPVLVLAVYRPIGIAPALGAAMVLLPNKMQWNSKYRANVKQATLIQFAMVFKGPFSFETSTIAATSITSGSTVTGPSGYMHYTSSPLPSAEWTINSEDNRSTFMCIVMAYDPSSGFTALYLPFNTRAPEIGNCVQSKDPGRVNDNKDNDCDNRIDEEFLNFIDDDGDGRIDEDATYDPAGFPGVEDVRPVACEVSANADFSAPVLAITGLDGCAFAGNGAFMARDNFTVETGADIGGVAELKIHKLGCSVAAQFFGYPYLYFRCKIGALCFSVTDTTCTDVCDPVAIRRKRQANSDDAQYVTTEVKVTPITRTRTPTTQVLPTPDILEQCLQHASIQLAGGVLLGLCLFSMLASCCFCFLLRGKWNSKKNKKKYAPHSQYTPSRTSYSRRY